MMNKNIDEIKRIELIFSVLSNLFSFPNREFLLSDIFILKNEISFMELTPVTGEIFKKLKSQLIENPNENLMVEYARLFVGPFKVIAPPYGSYYLEDCKLMGDSTIQVMNIYDHADLSINNTFKDLPDHIIAELEFLYFLFFNKHEVLSISDYNRSELIDLIIFNFYHNYFSSWVQIFANVIIENSSSEFYCNLGKLLNHIIVNLNLVINNKISNN
ncbi:MAG: cytoplasmic chaperone TorD family protein [Ignavibacteria bacterium]|nr:cytoplasmic chaperone TorD family protein [Ignavibacteria bacterium]